MPEIKVANQDTLMNVKSTAELTKSGVDALQGLKPNVDAAKLGVDTLLSRPAGFHFLHEMPPMSDDITGWQPMGSPPMNFQFGSGVYGGARGYIFGNSSTTSAATYRYDVSNNMTWTRMADAPVSLYGSAAAYMNTDIYVLSGQTGVNTRLHKYIAAGQGADTWTAMADAPVSSQNAAIGVINNELYVAGGAASTTALRKYTLSSDIWTSGLAALPVAAASAMGGVINGEFYVLSVGGKRIMKYNAMSNAWTALATPPFATGASEALTRCAHAVFKNKLVFAGVVDANRRQVWAYDPATDSWSRMADSLWSFNNGVGISIASGLSSIRDEFFAFGGPQATFHKMSALYAILAQQELGEVKKGQYVYYKTYGISAYVKLNDISRPEGGFTASEDGILKSDISAGFGAIRGWVK
ncbi:MAG: hypothetical protein FWF44_08740 [Defluviitaleaceae bacterium]|nr:hypothetical protein [Defluviitaleaceae bacterium]